MSKHCHFVSQSKNTCNHTLGSTPSCMIYGHVPRKGVRRKVIRCPGYTIEIMQPLAASPQPPAASHLPPAGDRQPLATGCRPLATAAGCRPQAAATGRRSQAATSWPLVANPPARTPKMCLSYGVQMCIYFLTPS